MSPDTARACFLDAESVGTDLDFTALEAAAGSWDWHGNTAPEQVGERLAGAQIAVSNKVRIGAAALEAAPHLRLICVAATGVNNIDLEAAAAHGVTVCNATAYATPSVVQHVFALLLALATRLERYHAIAVDGRWAKHPFFCVLDEPITELAGRRLGVVGHGELGRGVAATAAAFGMEVLVAARRGGPVSPDRVAFEDVLAQADALSLHCPRRHRRRGGPGAGVARGRDRRRGRRRTDRGAAPQRQCAARARHPEPDRDAALGLGDPGLAPAARGPGRRQHRGLARGQPAQRGRGRWRMSGDERVAAAEEWIMQLRMEQDQLDRVVQAQSRAIAGLQQRIERLERRLERLAPEGDE